MRLLVEQKDLRDRAKKKRPEMLGLTDIDCRADLFRWCDEVHYIDQDGVIYSLKPHQENGL